MREIAPRLRAWLAQDTPFAVATVVDVRGSAPRRPGAAMAVAADGRVAGSVSGGCVEGAVYEAAAEAIKTGEPGLYRYGISDGDAFEVGLTCGGTVEISVQPYVDAESRRRMLQLMDAVDAGAPVALATVISRPYEHLGAQLVVTSEGARAEGAEIEGAEGEDAGTDGSTMDGSEIDRSETAALRAAVADDARGLLARGVSAVRHYGVRGQRRMNDVSVFIQTFTPPARFLVFGATDYAMAAVRIGAFLGYRVTVCDARPVFATRERFPDADEVVRAWPHEYLATTDVDERTVVCVLTHDPKFDIPLLVAALRTRAGYIGVMGSRRTHRDRAARLRAEGVGEADLARLSSPVGLDLGARTPEETAVSIAAEIIKSRWGGTGRSLTELTGDIHAVRSLEECMAA
jgi:xanthine dehydrogenase accessory factor